MNGFPIFVGEFVDQKINMVLEPDVGFWCLSVQCWEENFEVVNPTPNRVAYPLNFCILKSEYDVNHFKLVNRMKFLSCLVTSTLGPHNIGKKGTKFVQTLCTMLADPQNTFESYRAMHPGSWGWSTTQSILRHRPCPKLVNLAKLQP